MKIISTISIWLLIGLSAFASTDSTRVILCVDSIDDCMYFPGHVKTVEHYDSTGRLVQSEFYRWYYQCNGTNDSTWFLTNKSNYTFDSAGHIVSNIDSTFYSGGNPYYSSYNYTYDSNGNVLSKLRTFGPPTTNFELYNYTYDANNNRTSELWQMWRSSIADWDTVSYSTWQYDGLNNKLFHSIEKWESFGFSWESILREYFVYDSNSDEIEYRRGSLSLNNGYDSTLRTSIYFSPGLIQESIYLQWDSLSMSFNRINRSFYEYDGMNRLLNRYSFACPDTLCEDSAYKTTYAYDAAGHLTDEATFEYDQPGWLLSSTSWWSYDASGRLIEEGDGYVNPSGCDESDTYYYTYNLSGHLVHSKHINLVCNYNIRDCDYYNLNEDSLLVLVQATPVICAFDSINIPVTVAGGHKPYSWHWSPSQLFSDSASDSPLAFVDSSFAFTLTITDSTGQTVSANSAVQVFPQSIRPVSLYSGGLACENQFYLTFNDDSLIQPWTLGWMENGHTLSVSDTFYVTTSNDYYLVLYDNQGCSVINGPVSVVIHPDPMVWLGADTTICQNDSLLLNPGSFDSYLWFDGSTVPTYLAYGALPDSTESYWVMVTDSNGCDNADTIAVTFAVCAGLNNQKIENTTVTIHRSLKKMVIENPALNRLNLQIYTTDGKEVLNESIVGLHNTISLEKLPGNFYLYRLLHSSGSFISGKFVLP